MGYTYLSNEEPTSMTFLHNSKIISSNRPLINNNSPKVILIKKPKQNMVFAPKYFVINR